MKPIAPFGNGRGRDGRFLPGNAGGPGNPRARQTAALREALYKTVTPKALGSVVEALLKKALDGDVQAAALLFNYALGRPSSVDNDRPAMLIQAGQFILPPDASSHAELLNAET